MAKIALGDVANLVNNEGTAISTINANNDLIELAIENTLSRDGSTPNQMLADLDMNSNQILNLPDPTTDAEPVTLGLFNDTIDALTTGAVVTASYVTMANNGTLANERKLTAGTNVSVTDGGANGNVTLDLPTNLDFTGKTITAGTFTSPTITSPTVVDSTFTIQDNVDSTKKLQFEVSGVTTGNTRTMTIPDANTTLVGTGATQTLTNKTLDNTNNVTLKDTNFTLQDDGDTTKQGQFNLSGISTGTTRTYNLPNVNADTFVMSSAAQTVSSKTFSNTNTYTAKDNSFTLQDDVDTTKQAVFQLSGITTGNTRTMILPDADATLVGTGTSQTLTGKTISGASNTLSSIALTSLATQADHTILMNESGGSASPVAKDPSTLVSKASPTGSDLLIISDQAASGAIKKATISAVVGGAGSVTSFNSRTGAIVSEADDYAQFNQPGTWNATLAASAAANALTIALKDKDGSDPSSTSPAMFTFRSATGITGSHTTLSVTSATSLVVSSGSTLGVTSTTGFRLWVVGFNDAGTFRLGVINPATTTAIVSLNQNDLVSSTAEGGAGAADSAGVFYTGTAVTSKPYVIIGFLEWGSSGVTAGTWTTTNLIKIQTFCAGIRKPGEPVGNFGTVNNGSGSTSSSTTAVDVTGASVAITPTCACNRIRVQATANCTVTAGGAGVNSLYTGNLVETSTTIAQVQMGVSTGSGANTQQQSGSAWTAYRSPNTTSSTTYKLQHFTTGGSSSVTTASVNMLVEEISV